MPTTQRLVTVEKVDPVFGTKDRVVPDLEEFCSGVKKVLSSDLVEDHHNGCQAAEKSCYTLSVQGTRTLEES